MSKLPLCFFILAGLTSCAQVNHSFKQSHFFAKPASYGRELRDIEGKPIARKQDTLYFIYLETSAKDSFQITSVQYNGKVYQAAIYPVSEETVRVGSTETGEEFVITNNPGQHLIRVELSEDETRRPEEPLPENSLQITGQMNARPFKLVLKKKTMLAADIRG